MAPRASARLPEGYLKNFLELVLDQSGATQVHLIARSMGSASPLKVLAALAAVTSRAPKFAQTLAALDMDREELATKSKSIFARKNVVTRGFTTHYASAYDRALIAASETRKRQVMRRASRRCRAIGLRQSALGLGHDFKVRLSRRVAV